MKVTPVGCPRTLTDPHCKASPGDAVDVPDDVGASLVGQGTWERVKDSKPTTKKPDVPADKEKD